MRRVAIATVALLGLIGCSSQEVLEARSAVAPEGVDFSGIWHIRKAASGAGRRSDRAPIRIPGSSNSRRRTSTGASGRSRSSSNGGQVHVFLETGSLLKVTQTESAFFVSVDRSIVEEFRFGENRTVNVGEIVARRSSGWEGPVYVVETLDRGGSRLIEQFWLSEDRNVLNRKITIRDKKQQESTTLQLFDREGSGRADEKSRDGTG